MSMIRPLPRTASVIRYITIGAGLSTCLMLAAGCSYEPPDVVPLGDTSTTPGERRHGGADAGDARSRSRDGGLRDGSRADASGACPSPVRISPGETTVAPNGTTTFDIEGGTGDYEVDAQLESGGEFTLETGVYAAGPRSGEVDRIEVRDLECGGSASARIRVRSMHVTPTDVTLEPKGGFAFEVTGGSGDHAYRLVQNESGGRVTDQGAYRAGTKTGTDVVRIRDVATGTTARANVEVREDASIRLQPERLALPVGASFELEVEGGSGYVEPGRTPSAVSFSGRTVTVEQAGRTRMPMVDTFTGAQTRLTIQGLVPREAEFVRASPPPGNVPMAGDVDIDGDGHLDAIVGHPLSNFGGHAAGAVYIYEGTDAGLAARPARIIEGTRRGARLGHALAVADVIGDARPDLVVGAPLGSRGMARNGYVHVYPGVDGRWFAADPVVTWTGNARNDRFGVQIEACDVDGDGRSDVAVSARFAEDREVPNPVHRQGAISLFVSGSPTFDSEPDTTVYGRVPEDGSWTPRGDLSLGHSDLEGGDVDGDGDCDLVAGMDRASLNGRTRAGLMYVFRGEGGTGASFVGLEATPIFAALGTRTGNRFGREVTTGDLDGDGRDEIAVGQPYYRTHDRGLLRLFDLPNPSSAATDIRSASEADWTFRGDQKWTYLGRALAVDDLDGDGRADMIVGSSYGSATRGGERTGVIDVHPGRDGQWPSERAAETISGEAADNRLGYALAPAGDVDGDGSPDLLSYARRGSDAGLHVGEPRLVKAPMSDDPRVAPLERPDVAAGSKLGGSVAYVSTTDSRTYLAAGAPRANGPERVDGGAVHVYRVTRQGTRKRSVQTLRGYPPPHANERFGYRVFDAGDVDGDGIGDLGVVARNERLHTAETPDDVTVGGCSRTRQWGRGAVFVHLGRSSAQRPFETRPSFVFYGPDPGRRVSDGAGDLDVDGDGYDDLVLGGRLWNRPGGRRRDGGYGVAFGRPESRADHTGLFCQQDYHLHYARSGDTRMGESVAEMGDVNGDGCDEFAVGAPRAGDGFEGRVHVVFGWNRGGGSCAFDRPHRIVFEGDSRNGRVGSALAGGRDLDGDGRPDLVVGADAHPDDRGRTSGAIWMIPGSHVASLSPRPMSADVAPSTRDLAPGSPIGDYRRIGPPTASGFGSALAILPGSQAPPLIAVGGPNAGLAGPPNTGATWVYAFEPADGRIGEHPFAVTSGETEPTNTNFGATIAATRIADSARLAVGAPWSHQFEPEQGTVFTATFR